MGEKSKRSTPGPGRGHTVHGGGEVRQVGRGDWAKVDATTDEDIARQIAEDPDTAPELDEAWFAAAADTPCA